MAVITKKNNFLDRKSVVSKPLVADKDGRFYIEDNWGNDAKGHPAVFNPFDRNSYPVFYNDFHTANETAAKIAAAITGSDYKQLMIEED